MNPPLSSELARHILDWRGLPWPPDWGEIFGREAPLCLEIGFGNGAFMAKEAREHPGRNHVAVELSWSAARRLLLRLWKHDLDNVRVLLIDAKLALLHLFEEESLCEVFANHPCPWPKARHHGRRLFTPELLDVLTSRMRTGARLTCVTDHAEYAQWVAERFEEHDAITSCHGSSEVADIPGHLPTKYQLKAMAQGIPIHYFEWQKVRDPRAPIPPSHRDQVDGPEGDARRTWHDSMPSISLRGDYDRTSLFGDALPLTVQETVDNIPVVARLEEPFRREKPAMWLVEAFATEGNLRQEFAILVIERRPKELFLKLSGLGRPHPTYGVKRAIAALAQVLVENVPHLEVLHENLGPDALVPYRPALVQSSAPAERPGVSC